MRQALGRGIDALISKAQEQPETLKARLVQKIPVDKVHPNRFQPRQVFNDESIKELAQSIQKHGLAQPIIVSRDGEKDTYELIAGERRLRASKFAGLREIDAVIRPKIDEKDRMTLSLIENIQREDLNAIDQALAYKQLAEKFSINQTELAAYCGKSKAAVSNTLRLLELEVEVQRAVQSGVIFEGHARALLAIPDKSKRLRLFQIAVERKMSVRSIEDAARELSGDRPPGTRAKRSKSKKSPEALDLESNLQKWLGTKVEVHTGMDPQKGYITIHYYSLEDLDRIISIFRRPGGRND